VAVDIPRARGVLRAARTITDLSARTLAAGQARIDAHASGKLVQMAEAESLRVVAAAQADLAQRSIERWLELVYDQRDGIWWNVREDGMIRLAPPWSRSRRKSYGLSEPQARLLYRIVTDLRAHLPERRWLYWYSPAHQRYVLNRSRFPTLANALEWQRSVGSITPAMWYSFGVKYPGGRNR